MNIIQCQNFYSVDGPNIIGKQTQLDFIVYKRLLIDDRDNVLQLPEY